MNPKCPSKHRDFGKSSFKIFGLDPYFLRIKRKLFWALN